MFQIMCLPALTEEQITGRSKVQTTDWKMQAADQKMQTADRKMQTEKIC